MPQSDLPVSPHNFRGAVAKLRGFYEEVGHYIESHPEFEKELLDIVGTSPVEIWNTLADIVKNERAEHGQTEMKHFEELVKRIKLRQ